mmetsp:Transcript_31589/g.104315  ORF Transcript_31589/g.104315 Transcript_31589/m.104315 type:complete len:211 (-) Transcript_31589:572-1204(-)
MARTTCGRVSTAHSASRSSSSRSVPRVDPRAEWRASLAGGSSAAARLSLRRGREATRQRPPPPPNASATTRPCICTGGVTPRACSRVGAASVDEIGTVSLPATTPGPDRIHGTSSSAVEKPPCDRPVGASRLAVNLLHSSTISFRGRTRRGGESTLPSGSRAARARSGRPTRQRSGAEACRPRRGRPREVRARTRRGRRSTPRRVRSAAA